MELVPRRRAGLPRRRAADGRTGCVGRPGPVFLDAECAWYGDPAFDLAFCLNHLLLKCMLNRRAITRFLTCYDRFAETYLRAVNWELRDELEPRAACLLPALLLGRVDGKSPVEYITEEADKERVRKVARFLLTERIERSEEHTLNSSHT